MIRRFGDDILVFASDFPHWDAEYPDNLHAIRRRDDLSAESKRKLLRENAMRLYSLAPQPGEARAGA